MDFTIRAVRPEEHETLGDLTARAYLDDGHLDFGEEWADIAGEGEAEFRMLAVAKEARGRGVGEALVRACVERARETVGCRRVVLSTQPRMASAHRIYVRTGFVRTPGRDWSPLADMDPLLTYALEL
ncbi:GNAT family N-acetyltransferase [Streptomyces sp. NPDC096030]|uniref:GNAT family N-acetyltransferase n=1 Tax=Streptomyces sp. NPDC096030 TaxID=3155423 RepID=UPI00331B58E5